VDNLILLWYDVPMSESSIIPWYIAGLAFECSECGRCCSGPEEGYVWATPKELDGIAEELGMTSEAFRKKYARKVGRRWSLVECPATHNCIFVEQGKCRVYGVRPTQCRTWPFWKGNVESPEEWAWAGQRCEGINRGKLHSVEHIQRLASMSDE
jgi:uncharacterized protein